MSAAVPTSVPAVPTSVLGPTSVPGPGTDVGTRPGTDAGPRADVGPGTDAGPRTDVGPGTDVGTAALRPGPGAGSFWLHQFKNNQQTPLHHSDSHRLNGTLRV